MSEDRTEVERCIPPATPTAALCTVGVTAPHPATCGRLKTGNEGFRTAQRELERNPSLAYDSAFGSP